MEQQESLFPLSFEPNSSSSVQANILLRLGIFTPVRRGGKDTPSKSSIHKVDLSDELRTLEISRKEGYERVSITGAKLNFDTDFKVWCGIVMALHSMKRENDFIELKFSAFSRYCGFSSKRLDAELRRRIEDSLVRLRTQTISFSKSTKSTDKSSGYVGGLINNAEYDTESDYIRISPDRKLWDLYAIDHQVLLKLKAMKLLARQEAAQCLYVFLCALPENPHPISFERIRERMQLTSSIAEQNRTITTSIKKLQEIGYLDGKIETKGGQRYLLVFKRCPKLSIARLPSNVVKQGKSSASFEL